KKKIKYQFKLNIYKRIFMKISRIAACAILGACVVSQVFGGEVINIDNSNPPSDSQILKPKSSFTDNTINFKEIVSDILDVYGGLSLYQDEEIVKSNKVNIYSGKVENVYGGSSRHNSANDNIVSITGGSITRYVYGGTGKAAINNEVDISGNAIIADVSVENTDTIDNISGVFGGYSDDGAVKENNIFIKNGTINSSVIGGYGKTETNKNKVTISGGILNKNVYGGKSVESTVTENEVEIKGGTIKENVYGGYSHKEVSDNTVHIFNATIEKEIYGGYSESDNVKNNMVSISGGNYNSANKIIGGFSKKSGVAENNEVQIFSGTFKETSIIGGENDGKGENVGNYILIRGGKFEDTEIYGTKNIGKSTNIVIMGGEFTNSKIYVNGENGSSELEEGQSYGTLELRGADIEENPQTDLSDLELYGSKTGSIVESKLYITGFGYKVKKIANFGLIVFCPTDYEHQKITKDDIVLEILDKETTDLSNTNIDVVLQDNGTNKYNKDSVIHLIKATSLTAPRDFYTQIEVGIDGFVKTDGYISLNDDNTMLNLTFKEGSDTEKEKESSGDSGKTDTEKEKESSGDSGKTDTEKEKESSGDSGKTDTEKEVKNTDSTDNKLNFRADSDTKILLEGVLANFAQLNEAANLLSSNLGQILQLGNDKSGLFTYAITNGSNKKIKTGSHVENKGFNINVGTGYNADVAHGNLLTGLFIELGRGSYDSFLDNGIVGGGKTKNIGGGIFARYEDVSGFYGEASLRAGRLSDKTDNKNIYGEYKTHNTYYGLHLGVGDIIELGENNKLDLYAKYFYAHTKDNDVMIGKTNVNFDSVNSHRIKIGFKENFYLNDNNAIYAGLAYQREFDAKANGSYNYSNVVYSIASPSMKGNTGVGELGYKFLTENVEFSIGATGYVGKERGVSGNLGFKYLF
ncbi:MAG: autotransporter outer membrane beta-barrel domain-containing protein, partial [Campylobacter sp.]|nr:autotransporter outer membrane beta-barrel domain-containing protein [Campylobacter sp.]